MKRDLWDGVLFGASFLALAGIWLQARAKRFFKIEIIEKKVPLTDATQEAYRLLFMALGSVVTWSIMTLIALWVAWWQIRKGGAH